MERKFCTACQNMKLVTDGSKFLQHKTTRRWRCEQCEINTKTRPHDKEKK